MDFRSTTFAIVALMAFVTIVATENPCCSFPCQNQGVCLNGKDENTYTCDCVNLEFYGRNCEIPYFFKRIRLWFKPSSESLHNLLVSPYWKWLWDIINSVEFLHDMMMKRIYLMRSDIVDTPSVYNTVHDYPTVGVNFNHSAYARTLPPVPDNCPTPMGVKGKKELPNLDLLVRTFFIRKKFRPEPMGSSVLMTFFAQHFTHMFFKTDLKNPGFTWGGHGVDVSSIYGRHVADENKLRSFKDGKMKMQLLNGEYYPLFLKDCPIHMKYPKGVPESNKFALGHEFYGLMPGLFLYQTIWMREHNRVCDIMKDEHPYWDDERLYQTAKLIILGETIKIVIEDYVQHLANYNIDIKYKPTVLFGASFQYQNKINMEFNHLYHWHPLMPDEFVLNGTVIPMKDYIFHSELVVKYGTAVMTDSLSRQRAGHMAHHNHGAVTIPVLKETIQHGRDMRFQSLNNYRKRFNLPAYTSFNDLTGEIEMASELEKLYKDVDAVEFYVGILLEKRRRSNLFGSSIVEVGGPFSVKGLMANPIGSKQLWRPSTFGGDVGFSIVKDATLEKLFCFNIEGPCPLVSLQVPNFKEGDVNEQSNFEFSRSKDEL